MEDEKTLFIEAVNKVLLQFESARRDPRFLDEANDAYRLSEDQTEDLRRFLLLNGKGRVSLQTSTRLQVRDLVVLFSILGLMGPKRRVIVVFSHIGTLSQMCSETTVLWYQLLGLRVRFALEPEEVDADLPSVDIIFTTRKFVDSVERSRYRESDKQMAHLVADAEVHVWEGSEVTWEGWEVTQSQTRRRWWEFWK